MDLIEVVGFIFMIFVMMFPIFKKTMEERLLTEEEKALSRENPPKAPRSKEQVKHEQNIVKEFLESLDIDFDEEEFSQKPPSPPPPPPPPKVAPNEGERRKEKFHFESNLGERHNVSKLRSRQLSSSLSSRPKSLSSDRFKKEERDKNYSVHTEKNSRVKDLLNKKLSLKEMILMQEILSSPKSLRDETSIRS